MRNIDLLKYQIFFDVEITENGTLSTFTFGNLSIEAENETFKRDLVQGFTVNNVIVNGKKVE